MINLAGNHDCDEIILEELYLANIPIIKVKQNMGEVPFSFIGKLKNWTFERAWSYWIVEIDKDHTGLSLKKALELHNKKNPVKNCTLGNVIRSGGHCESPSPDEYGSQPIYNDELYKQLETIGYKKQYNSLLKEEVVSITVGEISKLCNEGKLNVERYVNCYHIDSQIGLNEFVKFINLQD